MKKALLSLLILAVLIAGALSLSACSSEKPIPGLAWAASETLVYDITEDNAAIGTLTVVAQRLEPGDYQIGRFGDKTFTISRNSASGTRIIRTATDKDGNEIMYSESLLNGFTSLASYKKVNYAGKAYECRIYHEGKFFYYSIDGGSNYKKIKAKSGYLDNEHLYYIVRCYDLSSAYSSSYNILSPGTGTLEKISIAKLNTAAFQTIPYTDEDGNEQTAYKECVIVSFSKTDSPKGTSVTVQYSPADFELKGDIARPFNMSIFIPVVIKENNLTYTLISADAS
jgi:hypothetical protein